MITKFYEAHYQLLTLLFVLKTWLFCEEMLWVFLSSCFSLTQSLVPPEKLFSVVKKVDLATERQIQESTNVKLCRKPENVIAMRMSQGSESSVGQNRLKKTPPLSTFKTCAARTVSSMQWGSRRTLVPLKGSVGSTREFRSNTIALNSLNAYEDRLTGSAESRSLEI